MTKLGQVLLFVITRDLLYRVQDSTVVRPVVVGPRVSRIDRFDYNYNRQPLFKIHGPMESLLMLILIMCSKLMLLQV